MDYKIIKDNKIIDVVRNPKFVRFLPYGHKALTDRLSAHGIVGSDNQTIYSFNGPVLVDTVAVSIKEIDNEEFNRLFSLLNSGQEVCADESILLNTKRIALRALSSACKKHITAGFSVTLLDGNSYKFSLTAEDQLNLLNFENQLANGVDTFIYHADNQPCRIFVREDILLIIAAYRKHVLYHTTYFNAAKQYINMLTDISTINAFTYGMDISATVKDKLLFQILKNGGC